MANHEAIGGVSLTLQTLLEDRMASTSPDLGANERVSITLSAPDIDHDDVTGPRCNLFLYHITENIALKNQDIPGQGHPSAYGHPPLSLDLYYLMTAYGTTEQDDVRAHQVLGDAMRVFHDYAQITPNLYQDGDPANPRILDTSLLGEFEQVKITLLPFTLEDFSKIWTALPEANFRCSVAYQVSVVQIERQQPRRFPQPVGELPSAGPRVHAMPFRSPQIREIQVIRQDDPEARRRPSPYARIGDTLVIHGRNLAGESTRVRLGNVDATASINALRNDRIEVVIPDDAQLSPGVQPVQSLSDVLLGDPPEPHTGFQSNVAVFMLVPHIEELDTTIPGALRLNGSRLFDANRESLSLIGDEIIRAASYTGVSTPAQITFPLPDSLESGNYLVRVRVGGAESIDNVTLSIP